MPTISDVARRAGVSPTTVSRVLQGGRNVRAATRHRVQQAIDELGYVPSGVAQSMRSKRTRSLGLVVSDITNAFWTTVARGVEDVAQRYDYSVLFCNTDENLAKQLQYLDFLVRQRVDGVIIAPYDSDSRHLEKLRQRKIPTVLVDRQIVGWEVDTVQSDSASGARALVRHLIGLGHTRIAIISGPEFTSTAEDRVRGYCLALTEAGLPVDERLIKRGEFRRTSGQQLTRDLLAEGLRPTAIFAANNIIALGVIDALTEQGLRIPQDIALACFDDLPNASSLFPFLTVVAQPAYEMGVNAAQLLFSRLHSQAPLRPRHVLLPQRMIVRYSCGSYLSRNGNSPLSLPLLSDLEFQSILVKPLTARPGLVDAAPREAGLAAARRDRPPEPDRDTSNINRLIQALQCQESDRLPYLEVQVTSRAAYQYVLQHDLPDDPLGARLGQLPIRPEDQVQFALRLGMDAVVCPFTWHPQDLERAAPPSLADQLSYLERFLHAVQGTGVGVIASFSSFFQPGLPDDWLEGDIPQHARALSEVQTRMDRLVDHLVRTMQVVCGRFGDDLALVMVNDELAGRDGLRIPIEIFETLFPARMQRLVTPAQEYDLPLIMHTPGCLEPVLPTLYRLGFSAVHPVDPESNDIYALKRRWANRMALMGHFPTQLLVDGTPEEIETRVREYCRDLAPGGGYVLGSAAGIHDQVRPQNLMAAAQAVRKYGRYGSQGL